MFYSANNRLVSTVYLGVDHSTTAQMRSVQIRTDDDNSTLLEAAIYRNRIGCTFDWYSEEIACDMLKDDDFTIVVRN